MHFNHHVCDKLAIVNIQNSKYKRAVQRLYDWQYSQPDKEADSFSQRLFELIAKADPENSLGLAKGFPYECFAYMNWYFSEYPDDFFKYHGLLK